MKETTLGDLQASVQDKSAFGNLDDYLTICRSFLSFLHRTSPTRIVSPSHLNYIFFQYGKDYGNKITRPLNIDLFFESLTEFKATFERFMDFLEDMKKHQEAAVDRRINKEFISSKKINKVVYTIQQSIGSIGDSFDNPNQSRKRVGQLFENLVKLVIQEVGLHCESRTINIPIPDHSGYLLSYALDLVFSREKAILASETELILPSETVGSVKTTSKDRIDKIFLDKYLLTRLIGREIRVVAIFLHDVQRAQKGDSIFGINSTFKTNHFLGYTVALNKLDGVYYVDPRPEMITDRRLSEHIQDFQQFLLKDLWKLSER